MIRPGMVLGLARAESRLTRRLVRYWVFQGLALLIGVAGFLYYAFLHRTFSHWSGTAALLNPRFLVGFIGLYYLVGFLLGLVFLGYDLRARDTRERMVEVLDSQPFTNLELLLGKYLGILIPCWLPVVFISIVLAVIGLAMGAPVEPRSLVTFSVLMAIPAYCFVLGLTFVLTLLLRHRLLAAVVLIGLIVGLITINFGFVPIYMLPLVDLTGGFSAPTPSDITPVVIDMHGFVQRLGVLLMGLSMVWLAAAVHPRRDDSSRTTTTATGLAMFGAGVALCGWLVLQTHNVIALKADWKSAHEARSDEPAPDLIALTGRLGLDPGVGLDLDLDLRFRAPQGHLLNSALFSLNPGLEVRSVTDAGGRALQFEHDMGLLQIALAEPLPAGEQTSVALQITGRPDRWFAYLDAAFDPLSVNIQEGNVFLLGFESVIFTRRAAVLLPGVRWLPASGSEIGRGDPQRRATDFFDLDLTVEVPAEWTIAGPGRRQEVEGAAQGRRRYRFAPPAPLPEVALVAGPMSSRSVEIQGVQLEVLVHPSHQTNLEFFEDAAGEFRDWLDERLREAAEVGLAYPYDALTLVEVPGPLRGYEGGWRMDTTLKQPAMILMRESGFPTARFDVPFKKPERFEDREGGVAREKRRVLERFFENDFSGGNPFLAGARSFFSYQTSARGPEGLPLNYVCEDLSNRLVTDKQGYFSIHHYGSDLNQTINQTIGAIFQDQGADVSDALLQAVTSRSEVWDTVTSVSLSRLDPWEEPKKVLDVLTLKGGAMARSMMDDLGRQKTGNLLAALHTNRSGDSFTREDVLTAGQEVGEDLSTWLDVWIASTELPGFTLGRVRFDRIRDSEDGSARYQLIVTVSNGEATPGLVRLEYRSGPEDGEAKRERSDPVRVPGGGAVEIGLVTSEKPRSVRVVPYLSLNRQPFGVPLPAVDEETTVDAEPFVGSREVPWTEPDPTSIVVDDLDDGFSVETVGAESGLRVAGKGVSDEDTDQGLPIAQLGRPPSRWSRRTAEGAWGKYRHTMALIRAGKGKKRAIFSAEIPQSGPWELEYYLPSRRSGPARSGTSRGNGTWALAVVDPSGSQDVSFDANAGEIGWNSLGTFEIAAGETRVEVFDKSEGGRIVMADAIRWRPASRGNVEEARR